MTGQVVSIERSDAVYPPRLTEFLREEAPSAIFAEGNLALLLPGISLAVLSSRRCPGSLIIKTQDFAHQLRRVGSTVVSGFQSPVERECLRILLRGKHPLVVCPARGMWARIPKEYRSAFDAGRILIVSSFPETVRRATRETARARNRFVAALADSVLILHAEPGSSLVSLAREVVEWGKPLYTLEDEANEHLVEIGAVAIDLPAPGTEVRRPAWQS